jgi:N-carbamoylputrescine amidase
VKISVCQLPDNLSPGDPAWSGWVRHIERERPDLALLNEMPFGAWIANRATFDHDVAAASIHAHESALPALQALPTAVIGSRPVRGKRALCNEAFLIAGNVYQPCHHKHYFPQEAGFFEQTWFGTERSGFEVIEYKGLRIGVLLCTELMFTEWARHYRRHGAHVIVSPRATSTPIGHWDTAARMAAVVSGCYVLSSNRMSAYNGCGPSFGGRGFAYSPTGDLLAETSPVVPIVCVNIDLAKVAHAQRSYPCNVREL